MRIPTGIIKPALPDLDYEEWRGRNRMARIKPMVQHWATHGFGAPKAIYLLYIAKIAAYAAGAVFECQRRGMHVPDDLAVCGFGNAEVGRELFPALTTVDTRSYEMGRRAAHALLSRLAGEAAGQSVTDVGFEVIERAILPEELPDFSECFLTGSAAEVTPVSEIGPYRFTPSTISETLMNDYMKEVYPAAAIAAE